MNSAGLIDDQRSSEKVLAVTGEDAPNGLFVSQFDETEASGLTGETVDGNGHRPGGEPVTFKPLMQLILVRLIRQIADKYLLSQRSAVLPGTLCIDVNNMKCIVLLPLAGCQLKEDGKRPWQNM
jgi:hypothetical protein